MAINWGLINPEIPAQARTIDAFGAVEAGRNQVRAQQEQQQMSGLRAIQMQSAKQGLDDAKSSQEAAQLAAQAFELYERDPEAARPLFEHGYQTNAKAFTDVFKGLQAQKDAHRKSQLDEDKTKAELLDKNAPIMLAAIDAEDKQPGAGRAILEQAGIYDEQVHGTNLADPTKRAAARQYLEQMPVIVSRRAAEE